MPNDFNRGCTIPALQSVFVCFLSAIIAGGVAYWMTWDFFIPFGLVIGAAMALFWFMGSIDRWREDVYTPLYAAPEPVEATSSVVRVEVVNDNQVQIAELPGTPKQLQELSAGLLSNVAFSEAAWAGSNRPFSRAQFQSVRAEFLKRGWLYQRNPEFANQGYDLSPAGKAVCRQLSNGRR
jgi:hypothetical protein